MPFALFSAAMSHMAAASRCLEFENLYKKIDPVFKEALMSFGMNKIFDWNVFFEHPGGTHAHEEECRELARACGAKDEAVETWAGQAAELHLCATKHTGAALQRVARVEGYALTADLHHYEKVTEREAVKRDLRVLEGHGLAHLPTEWRGKRYKRTEGATELARANAEHKERTRRGRELTTLLLEAGLPFAHTQGAAAGEEGALLRCCRGLSSKTLEQRLACWKPFRRWLLAEGHGPWPTTTAPFLQYLEVRRAEGAARTAFNSLKDALAFMEEAGEVSPGDRISQDPAVTNAVKEATLRVATEHGRGKARGQAPQLPLLLLADLEDLVAQEDLPVFQRAFAAFRLLRHWASLRWDDTQGLSPSSLERRARGVVGLLERTKTSGPGKVIQVLPCFVSQDAWVKRPWLDTGLALLTQESFNFERDFLLRLPSLDLQAATKRRALYTDAAAFFLGAVAPTAHAHRGSKAARGRGALLVRTL